MTPGRLAAGAKPWPGRRRQDLAGGFPSLVPYTLTRVALGKPEREGTLVSFLCSFILLGVSAPISGIRHPASLSSLNCYLHINGMLGCVITLP